MQTPPLFMSKRFAASSLASSAAKAKADKDSQSGNQVVSKTLTSLPSDSSQSSRDQTASTAVDSANVETAPMTKKESVATSTPSLSSLSQRINELASSTLTPTSGDASKPMEVNKSRMILSSIASRIAKPQSDAGQKKAETAIDSGGASNSLASIAQRVQPLTVTGSSEEPVSKTDGTNISEPRDSAMNMSSALSSFTKRIQSSQQPVQSSTAAVPPGDSLTNEKNHESKPSVMSSKASSAFSSFTQKMQAPLLQKDANTPNSSEGSPADMFGSFASRIKQSQVSSVLKRDEDCPDNPTKPPEKKMGFGTSIAFSGLSSRLSNTPKPAAPTTEDAPDAGKHEAEQLAAPKKEPEQKATSFTSSIASMRTQTLFNKKDGSSKTTDQSIDKAKESVTQAFASFGKFISTIDDPKARRPTTKRWKDKDELIRFDDGEDSAETTNESNELFDPSHDSIKGVLTEEL